MGFLDYIQKIARATDSNGNISPIKTLQDEETRKEIEQRLALDLRNKINDGTIPRYFYKYRSLPHALEIIRSGKLKFSTIDEFKDPFDGMGDRTGNEKEDYNTLTEKFIARLPQEMPVALKENIKQAISTDPERYFKEHAEMVIAALRKNTGIFCMSPIYDDIIMWSYYADSHKGVCLKLDILQHPELFYAINKVDYQREMPRESIIDAEKFSQSFWSAITTKHQAWFYEQEVRVIHHRENGFLPFNKQVLKEILFGVYTTQGDIDKVKAALQAHGYSNVALKKATLHDTRYKLQFHDI